jgi:hypothetical protein
MGAKQLLEIITLVALEQVFEEAEENLETDMSVIRISLIRDVHYESLELKVLVYGLEDGEEDAPVAEWWLNPDRIGTEVELSEEGISPYRLRALFSEDVLDLMRERNIQIQWFCEDGYLLRLDLHIEDKAGVKLVPIDQ